MAEITQDQNALIPLAARAATIADWSPTVCRYFLLDYDGGLDTNLGYVDAVPGSTLAPAGLAIKTSEKLRQILPKFGNGLKAVVLIKPRAGFANYLKQDGVTEDELDFRGVSNYGILFPRASSDLTNSSADRVNCGFLTAVAGPGAGGVFTVGVGSTTSNIVSSDVLPAENSVGLSTITAFRVRFVTGALAGTCHFISSNNTGSIQPGSNMTAAPANGDTFVVERPGVRFSRTYDVDRAQRRFDGTFATDRSYMVGICGTATTGGAFLLHGGSYIHVGCELINGSSASTSFLTIHTTQAVTWQRTYIDEAGTSPQWSIGMGFRCDGLASITIAQRFQMAASAFIPNTFRSFITAASWNMGNGGDYFGLAPRRSAGSPAAYTINNSSNGQSLFGPSSLSTVRPARCFGNASFDCAVEILAYERVQGLKIEQAGAFPLLRIKGTGFSCNIDEISGSTGNTGYVLNLDNASNVFVSLGARTAITALATTGDIVDGSLVVTLAQLAWAGWRDERGNVLIGSSLNAEVAQGILCTASGALALGDNVRVTASGVVTKAQADSSGNASHVAGCVQNAALNGATCMVVVAGVGLMRFDTSPPTAPNIAYLSEAVAGEAKTSAPATGGGRQLLRVGKVLRPIAGQPLALAAIRPEYEPVPA